MTSYCALSLVSTSQTVINASEKNSQFAWMLVKDFIFWQLITTVPAALFFCVPLLIWRRTIRAQRFETGAMPIFESMRKCLGAVGPVWWIASCVMAVLYWFLIILWFAGGISHGDYDVKGPPIWLFILWSLIVAVYGCLAIVVVRTAGSRFGESERRAS